MSDINESVSDEGMGDTTEEIVHIIQDEEEEDISDVVSQKFKNAEESDMMIMVPPLLSVNKDAQRIPISIGEIKRRVEAPEKLCATNLLSLLHLSKPRTPDLKETLSQYGLEKISKRSAQVSSFTKLSETEASHLAEDFYFLASRSLDTKEIGDEVAAQNGGWENFEEEANELKTLLEDISSLMEEKDTDLNLVTHGFSSSIMRSMTDLVSEILTPQS